MLRGELAGLYWRKSHTTGERRAAAVQANYAAALLCCATLLGCNNEGKAAWLVHQPLEDDAMHLHSTGDAKALTHTTGKALLLLAAGVVLREQVPCTFGCGVKGGTEEQHKATHIPHRAPLFPPSHRFRLPLPFTPPATSFP